MKRLLIEVDESMFTQLERIAPAHLRRRSAFLRTAIQKAISEEQKRATAQAYRMIPDSVHDAWFDPRVWEPRSLAHRARRRQ